MLLLIILLAIGALGYESLEQEDALQRLREGNFDIVLDVRSLEDFETIRLEGAFHLGSLKHRARHHQGRESESSSSSDSSEDEQMTRHGQLGRHARHLRGCEDSTIAVHSMGTNEDTEFPFSTAEVAQFLSESGFNSVFDLGDVAIAEHHDDIAKTSGERTGRCKPECALGRGPPHGYHGHHGHHGHHGRPQGEHSHEHNADAMGSYYSRHRARHHDSSNDDSRSVTTSFVKYFGITFGAFVILSILICFYKKCMVKDDIVVVAEQPQIQEGSQIEGSGFSVAINDPETGSPIETINGSPEGWGEDTTKTDLPPSFEEVAKAAVLNKQYHTLAE